MLIFSPSIFFFYLSLTVWLWVAWMIVGYVSVVIRASNPTQGKLYSSLMRTKMLFEFDEAVGELVSLWPQPPLEAVR